MATRLFSSPARVTAYLPNIRAAVQHFRNFSSYDKLPKMAEIEEIEAEARSRSLGVFGPGDKRFPLPGKIGVNVNKVAARPSPLTQSTSPQELFETHLPDERHSAVVEQVVNQMEEYEEEFLSEADTNPMEMLECVAQPCPQTLRRDVQELFPSRDLSKHTLTVITISHRTSHDMSGWSHEVEEEREMLLAAFIKGASDICEALNNSGFWADFIDPSCGRPYFSAHTNSTFFETDERYRKLGFEIEDLGCCKVIAHHLWGTHAYVGSLFTTASTDHPLIACMVQAKYQPETSRRGGKSQPAKENSELSCQTAEPDKQ
ncbi:cobalamin trafficking protein CblD-like [Ostrea edulis]|uniref:cobalamin trafficking protein CblD-like n=1 Tax=Ostrea edulis TaxID=37623 RepID=UPI0024AFA7B5|nr:cobalamin trafficking protein CblD-like [Ostrea edulis]